MIPDTSRLSGGRDTGLAAMGIKRNSIYFRLIQLLMFAAFVTGIVHWGMQAAGNYILGQSFANADFVNRQSEKRVSELQDYITKEGLTIEDTDRLSGWMKRHPFVELQVYKENDLIYDSVFPVTGDTVSREEFYEGETFYRLSFADDEAIAFLYDFYVYRFYTYAMFGNLLVSFLVFLSVVMLGIRKTMDYIRCLSREIGILESGNLEYPITVRGKDELALLAASLENMRKSFRAQVEQEAHLTQANRRMITEMSHDLRTPLTALMIYTGILKSRKYRDEQQMREYIDTLHRKAHQMKQLSDHIFEYARISSETKIELEGPEGFREVFFDLLSETCFYLEQNGFQVSLSSRWGRDKVRIHPEYISRILDNLMSNITKYADPHTPVQISVSQNENYGCISFENRKKICEEKEETTKIGLNNIKNMMSRMGGRCEITEDEQFFKIQLFFHFCR